jgi:hypothetical protein
MNGFIFNVLPPQGPTIPMWVPFLGGFPINSPLVGSFLGVFLAFVINWLWQRWGSKRLNFEEEYHIKAELSRIEHNLRVGSRPRPIKPIYGADHVIKYRLFGEYRTQIVLWYEGFQRYNFQLEDLVEQRQELLHLDIHDPQAVLLGERIEANRKSMANQIDVFLRSDWLKRIPDDTNNSGLSRTKFIWYWLKQDALEEPTTNRQFWVAALDKLLGAGVQYSLLM